MHITVVIVGIPQYVSCADVEYNLKQIFQGRIGLFEVRDLRETKHRTYKWQFALDFNSAHDASTAQRCLHGYNYVLPSGIAYVLCAQITEDPELMREKKRVVPRARSKSNSGDEDWAILGLVPKVTDDKLYKTCARMDAQIEYLNKQKLLLQAERELLIERKQLWKEYNRENDSDSDFENKYRRKSPKGYNRTRRRSRSKHSRNSNNVTPSSRDNEGSYRSLSKIPDFPNDGLILPSTSNIPNQSTFPNIYTNEYASNDVLQQNLQNYYNGQKENSFKATVHDYKDVNADATVGNEIVLYKQKAKYNDIKFEINETVRKIIKEMDTVLDKVNYEKNINILEKGLNFTIIRKLKDIVKARIETFEMTNYMSSSAMLMSYRRYFSSYDDKQLIEKLVDEYLAENPHIQNKCTLESINSSESSFSAVDSEENIMWQAVDEVLKDIKIEMLSSDKSDDEEVELVQENKTTQVENVETLLHKEIINVTHERLVDSKNNRQVEITVVLKNNTSNILNLNTNKQINEADKTSADEVDMNNKIVNPNPIFYITLKVIMKQMKYHIREFEIVKGVKNLKATVERDIRNKIMALLKGKTYMKSAEITKLFRENYPRDNDRLFIAHIAEYLKNA